MELVTNNIIVGAGLISLDVLIWDGQRVPISYYVGGTCGNVMMILSYMGWDAYPIARLDGTKDGVRVLDDMNKHRVHTDFIFTRDGKTPVIVQRNFINKDGIPTHKFESRNNIGRFYLDFKSLTLKQANEVIERIDFVWRPGVCQRVSATGSIAPDGVEDHKVDDVGASVAFVTLVVGRDFVESSRHASA